MRVLQEELFRDFEFHQIDGEAEVCRALGLLSWHWLVTRSHALRADAIQGQFECTPGLLASVRDRKPRRYLRSHHVLSRFRWGG